MPWLNHVTLRHRGRAVRLLAIACWMAVLASPAVAQNVTVTATWDANPVSDNIAGYTLEYGTQPGSHPTSLVLGNVTSRAVSLATGYVYYFVVKARNTSGLISDPSTEVSVDLTGSSSDAPTLVQPASQWSGRNTTASLQLVGRDPDGDTVTYGASGLPPGLGVNPATGLISGTPSVLGSYSVTATASDGTGSSSRSFAWNIVAGGGLPFGAVDTPTNGASNIAGAMPITGWALDDVTVQRVDIWRQCVESIDRAAGACTTPAAGMPANFVYVGTSSLIPGARPDVEASNPTYPNADRAGWGFVVLTNALPHQGSGAPFGGQGSYALTAIAVDQEGQSTVLGTKNVTLNNDQATLPFGTIDTPAQGGTIPDVAAPFDNPNVYPAFGWAMTQQGKCIDVANPSRYRIYVDGVQRSLSPGTNWVAGLQRSDLSNAFPGLCNTNNALAVYYINAAGLGLSDGLHTISWDVTDSGNNMVAGLGTRFFTVQAAVADARDLMTTQTEALGDAAALSDVTDAVWRTVTARVSEDAEVAVVPDASGQRALQFPIGRRLHLNLDGPVSTGYLKVGHELRRLPVGSALDGAAGVFSWEPPAGVLGAFPLVFAQGAERLDVTVNVVDGSQTVPDLAMNLDTPFDDATLSGPVAVAGWALDPKSVSGTGVDAVHVWAVRTDVGAAPAQFLGAASFGPRPDVAAAFGAQFQMAGFHLEVDGLDAGNYEITAYVWNHRNARWEDARTVHVRIR